MSTGVHYGTEDRQWDIRLNFQTDEYLDEVVTRIRKEYEDGKLKYILIGGLEVGTRPMHSDYGIRHSHICAIFVNRASKSSIISRWGIKIGHGLYMVPRNRDLPYSGWRDHHIKEFSKIDPNKTIIYEAGDLPKDVKAKATERSADEKKRKLDDILIEMRTLIEAGEDQQAWTKFPRNYLQYGEKIKTMVNQRKTFTDKNSNPHLWIYGFPGTGKTQILNYIYPKYYKKDLNNRFFDLYNPDEHTHVMLEDVDHMFVDKLGIQFLKTLCDEAGFNVDQKYKTPQLARTTVLVTSNFDIDAIVPDGKGVDETKMALHRRFWMLRIDMLMRLLGLKLLDKWDRNRLKESGNNDPGKLYYSWDYNAGCPTGLPIKTPEEYQTLIHDAFYNHLQ